MKTVSWLRSSNLLHISLKRTSAYSPIPFSAAKQTRTFFGLGEIVGVLAKPGETLRSLAESRKLLAEARQEIQESKERAQLRPVHTFSPLPGFFARHAEIRAIEGVLSGTPSFTVLFGSSSVGKTALLREVLSRDRYHVLFFDLRIAGFADLKSLYFSLVTQMEQYFDCLKDQPGWKDWEKEGWAFKHDRLNVERRVADGHISVECSDIARVMELFQSSLLKYWQFQPHPDDIERDSSANEGNGSSSKHHEKKMNKKIPVVLLDEAHKLPALIQSADGMKILLDSFLVLTKQDRLCHVIHATSDSYYQTWLRQLNVMQHCKIISIGDCSKSETNMFFFHRLMPTVPGYLQEALSKQFEDLYDAFGGKLAHWSDFVTDYINVKGNITVKQTSHFLQAHALLNLQLIHSTVDPTKRSKREFRIYSPIPQSPHSAPSPADTSPFASSPSSEPTTSFTSKELLIVMRRITSSGVSYLPYFALCRELGADAVDGMVQGRILDLRWTKPITDDTASSPSDADGNIGPKLVPTTPILKYAMQTVLEEWRKATPNENNKK